METDDADLVFQDCETTGLEYDADIWEYAGVRRRQDGTEDTLHLFIRHSAAKRERMPLRFRNDLESRYNPNFAVLKADAARKISQFVAGAHIVGAVPDFDTNRLGRMLRLNGLKPTWHYHLIDVEVLALGWLAARGRLGEVPRPWDSEVLSRMIGVEPPPASQRHTAMGDVKWIIDMYDRIAEDSNRGVPAIAAIASEVAIAVLRDYMVFDEWWGQIPPGTMEEIKFNIAQVIARAV